MRVITTDIDGVLNFYPNPLIDFVNQCYGAQFTTKCEIKKFFSPSEYAQIKARYRLSDHKRYMKFNIEVADTIKKYATENRLKILVITSRQIEKKEMYELTTAWLDRNDFNYDLRKKDHFLKIEARRYQHVVHIDDEHFWHSEFVRAGLNSVLYNHKTDVISELVSVMNMVKGDKAR